jgi:hypothetical protein
MGTGQLWGISSVTIDPTALQSLARFGGFAAIIAGGLRILTAMIPYDPDSASQELLFSVIDVGLLFGIFSVYLFCADRTRRAGLVSFVVAITAIASIVGPDSTRFGIDFYRFGAIGFLVALAGFATLLLRYGLLIPAASAWLVSLTFGMFAATGNALALSLSGIALGIGFMAAGGAILTVPGPVRSSSDRLP